MNPVDSNNNQGNLEAANHLDIANEEAVVKIQSAVRGFLARRRFTTLVDLQAFADKTKETCENMWGQIRHVGERLSDSLGKGIVKHKVEIQHMDALARLRDRLQAFQGKVNAPLSGDDAVDATERKETLNSQLADIRESLRDLQRQAGFRDIKEATEAVVGPDYKSRLSADAVKTIKSLRDIFVPTAYELAKVDRLGDDQDLYLLGKHSGRHCEESSERIDAGLPYVSESRFFDDETNWQLHDVNIPFVDAKGKQRIAVVHGYFRTDSINISRQIPMVREKYSSTWTACESLDIPHAFKRAYVDQYNTGDLLAKEPEQIAEDVADAHKELQKIEKMSLVKLAREWTKKDTATQIRWVALLLMAGGESERNALFLHDMAGKVEPEYVSLIRNSLHFSLQRKLSTLIMNLEDARKRLSKLDANDLSWEDRILASAMPDDVKARAMDKVKDLSSGVSGGQVEKWLKGIVKVPFNQMSPMPVDRSSVSQDIKAYLSKVRGILDKKVYGHEKAKETVIEWLAQRIANGDSGGESIALQGPPGNGKTSLAKALAEALDRPILFIGLGGREGSSFLVGHGFTYVGSDWGKIVDGLQKCGRMDPIIYFDELDKVPQTPKGREIIGILTHLIDSTQNTQFHDEFYQGVDFDLSKALFVFSYNDESVIDPILKDRMITIRTKALPQKAKMIIADKYLLPELKKDVGFDPKDISFDDEIIHYIMTNYTFEAGVRRLKEHMRTIVRKVNRQRLEEPDQTPMPYKVTKKTVEECLGKAPVDFKPIHEKPTVGTVNGLYATTAGIGGLIPIQSRYSVPKHGRLLDLQLTGNMKDVMKESMQVARTMAWNIIPADKRTELAKGLQQGLHVHCSDTSTPKDGPSAGGAITVSMVSRLMNVPVRNDVAMTGEMDNNGNITAIGGLRAKLQGAKVAGVRKVCIPEENRKDYEEIQQKFPELFEDGFEVVCVDNIYDLLEHTLVKNPIKRPQD